MEKKGTPATVVRDGGKITSYCGKNADKNKAKKDGVTLAVKKPREVKNDGSAEE